MDDANAETDHRSPAVTFPVAWLHGSVVAAGPLVQGSRSQGCVTCEHPFLEVAPACPVLLILVISPPGIRVHVVDTFSWRRGGRPCGRRANMMSIAGILGMPSSCRIVCHSGISNFNQANKRLIHKSAVKICREHPLVDQNMSPLWSGHPPWGKSTEAADCLEHRNTGSEGQGPAPPA